MSIGFAPNQRLISLIERNCEKRVIDPKTGEIMDAALYVGVVYANFRLLSVQNLQQFLGTCKH